MNHYSGDSCHVYETSSMSVKMGKKWWLETTKWKQAPWQWFSVVISWNTKWQLILLQPATKRDGNRERDNERSEQVLPCGAPPWRGLQVLLASPAEAQQERVPNGEEVLFYQTSILPNTPRYHGNWSTLAFKRNLCLFQIRKRGMRCRSSNPRVVKTIRLRRAGLEPWLYQTNIKVPIRNMTNLVMENGWNTRLIKIKIESKIKMSTRLSTWCAILVGSSTPSPSGQLSIFLRTCVFGLFFSLICQLVQ